MIKKDGKNICRGCGKKFTPKYGYPNQKYCSYRCRLRGWKKNEQLCWTCAGVCSGCEWILNGKPIKGWEAKPHIVEGEDRKVRTYKIKNCPNYIRDCF